jgi:drug/metabolite transporter (DMT)-like permease
MEGKLWLAIMLAITASACLNVGKAMQKWKVKVLRQGVFKPENRKDFSLWICGVLLTMAATPLFSLALNNTDKPSLVSAMNGMGMIGLVLFAWLVLREKIGAQEISGALLVFAGATVMGLYETNPQHGQTINLHGLLFIEVILLGLCGPAAYLSWRTRKLHGLAFGTLVGILLGTAVILGKLALVQAGNDFIGQLKNPYPYAALLVGLGALILTQFAFWRSSAMVVVPTMNSLMILSPALFQYFALDQTLKAPQYPAIIIIVIGVVLLTATERADKLEGRPNRA